MKQMATTTCSKSSHPEFVFSYDPAIPEFYADWLRDALQHMVEDGQRFKAGETFQCGWMITQVVDAPGKRLTLKEPDMKGLPVKYVESVSSTLRHTITQRLVAESLGLDEDMDFPNIQQGCMVCSQVSDTADEHGFQLKRFDSDDERDSGWFLGCLDKNHDHDAADNLGVFSLYDVVSELPEIAQFLALPASIEIYAPADADASYYYNDKEIEPEADSFLAMEAES